MLDLNSEANVTAIMPCQRIGHLKRVWSVHASCHVLGKVPRFAVVVRLLLFIKSVLVDHASRPQPHPQVLGPSVRWVGGVGLPEVWIARRDWLVMGC
jgi:hypothetical protein